MKIIKEPNNIITCPTCGCVFKWDKNDLVDTRNLSCKIPRLHCPVCEQLILLSKKEVQPLLERI